MTRQEVFELLDDTDCISAVLNSIIDRKLNTKKQIEVFFKDEAPYVGLDYAFPWRDSEEGYDHWLLLHKQIATTKIVL